MSPSRRGQVSAVDLLLAIAVIAIPLMLLPAALLARREDARLRQCQDNLRRIGMALERHHEAKGNYPPAAIQPDAGAGWRLKDENEWMVASHANWAILLLPYIDEARLAAEFHAQKPISDPSNLKLRTTELPWMTCSEDNFHRPDNPYRCMFNDGKEILYARGNYAINLGSSSVIAEPGDPKRPVPDGVNSSRDGSRIHLVGQWHCRH